MRQWVVFKDNVEIRCVFDRESEPIADQHLLNLFGLKNVIFFDCGCGRLSYGATLKGVDSVFDSML